MSKKHSIEFIRKSFEKEGYQLLSKEYTEAHQKLNFKCNKGHIHSITYASWSRGTRCSYCYYEKIGDRCRIDFNIIKKSFKNAGYKLFSKKYKGNKQKLAYECPHGHKSEITWHGWSAGQRCKKCFYISRKTPINDLKKEFTKRGYTLLSTKYKDVNSKIKYICPNGHRHKMQIIAFRRGNNCPTCAIEIIKKKLRKPINEIVLSFQKEGYALLTPTSEYKNANQKLKVQCPRGHIYHVRWRMWNSGRRCRNCFIEDNVGSNHYSWRGGISAEPYCFIFKNKEWRGIIYERDKEKFCWNPLCEDRGSQENLHHIDYNKKNCGPKNIIKICNSCNGVANFNRDWWEGYYTEVMRRRFI